MTRKQVNNHDEKMVKDLSEATGLSRCGIKRLTMELCKEFDAVWLVQWKRFNE